MTENDGKESLGVLHGVKGVLAYLDHIGIKISLATVYRHRKEGKLVPLADGNFSLAAVNKYIAVYCKPQVGPTDGQGFSSEQLREVELKKRSAQARLFETRAQQAENAVVDKEEAQREILAKMIAVRSLTINSMVNVASDLAGHFGIKPERIPELVDFISAAVEANLARVSETEGFDFVQCRGCPILPAEDGGRCVAVRFFPIKGRLWG